MYIFDIKRYAINDGPGIRTTLFIKGCPLRCVWCHNPEGWASEPQVLFKQSKCIRCGMCNEPGFTVDDCPTTARELCGREYAMDELMAEVEKERAVMENSGGGVTLCGGEPLMHPEDTLAILRELGRRGFHRTVDTSLYAKPEVVDAVAAECELLLIDLKLMDSEKHRRYTGVGNELILENIRRVAETGHNFRIRIPLIEGVNADEENIEATARFLSSLSILYSPLQAKRTGSSAPLTLHLLPYHDVGKDKHRRMMPPTPYNPQGYPMAVPSEETLQRCRQQLESHGLRVVIGG
jgi:pyruvate formate lyase activating enzyme